MGKFKFTTESFIEEARRVHGDKYDYSKVEYKGTDVKVCIICPKHGEFWQTPKNHLYGRGCLKCYGHYKLTTEEFIEKLKKLYGDKYDYSYVEYNGSYKKVHLVCPIHGDFWIEPNRLMQGQGCHKCGIKMAQMKNRMKLYKKGLFLSVIMLLAISCTTNNVVVEYFVPDVDWPEFPILTGNDFLDVQSETVSVPAEWYIDIGIFRNKYKGCIEQYIRQKEEVENWK